MAPRSANDGDSGRRSLQRAVIDAVADAEGVDPIDLDPIYRVVDPDALGALFAGRDGEGGGVVFRFHGYRVTVDGEGRVTLEAP